MWDSVMSCCGAGAKLAPPPLILNSLGKNSKRASTASTRPRDLADRWGAQLLHSAATTATTASGQTSSGQTSGQSAQGGSSRQSSQAASRREQAVANGASEWGKLNVQSEQLQSPQRSKSDVKSETPHAETTEKITQVANSKDKSSIMAQSSTINGKTNVPNLEARRNSNATVDGLLLLNSRLTEHAKKLQADLDERHLQLLATGEVLAKPSLARPEVSTVSQEDIGVQEWLTECSQLTAENPITNEDYDTTLREGKSRFSQSDFEGAALYFQHALTLGSNADNRRQQARAQANLANALAQHGKLWVALRNLKGALSNIRAMGDAKLESYVLNTGILICVRLEHLDEALGFALRKLGVAESPQHKEEATMWIDKINKAMNGEITLNVGQMG